VSKYLLFLFLCFPVLADSYESVATLPSSNEDEVWVITNRTIDGVTRRYIEQFQPVDWGSDSNDMYFVDCGNDDINDLSHLEGEQVSLFANARQIGTYTVADSNITITDANLTTFTVGLPYTSVYESMPLVKLTRAGLSSSKRARIINTYMDFYKSLASNIGAVSTNTSKTKFSSDEFATILEPVTELKPILFPNGWNMEPCIYIDVNSPVPLTLRAMYPRLEITGN